MHGHCVICDAEGTGEFDFICSDCGDPLGVTLYCRACGRRLALDTDTARAFLAEHGYHLDDLDGVVLKMTRCATCMRDDDVVDLAIYRLRLGG